MKVWSLYKPPHLKIIKIFLLLPPNYGTIRTPCADGKTLEGLSGVLRKWKLSLKSIAKVATGMIRIGRGVKDVGVKSPLGVWQSSTRLRWQLNTVHRNYGNVSMA